MLNKRILSLLCCAMMATPVLWSQPSPENRPVPNPPTDKPERPSAEERKKMFEEMRHRQIAFFTDFIGLTTEEAEAFWPIYNDIRGKRWKINHELRKCLRPIKEEEQATFDYERRNKRILELYQQNAAIEKECYERLRKILSPEKLFKYYCAEDAFNKELLKNFDK